MKMLASSAALERNFTTLINRYRQISFAVAWASDGFPGYGHLVTHRKKINKSVVGIHFNQTHPEFIRKFMNDTHVRFIKRPDGVFHPKFYLFENSAKEWQCLLGSANFTRGGFSSNEEACLLFGDADSGSGAVFRDLHVALAEYWEMGERFDPAEFELYRTLWKRFRERSKTAGVEFNGRGKETPILKTPLLQMSWAQYLRQVQKGPHHKVSERANVLATARKLFDQYEQFRKMPIKVRGHIAGYVWGGGAEWGWFGSMFGAGIFKGRVNKNDANLSRALDAIPPTGEVKKEHYLQFVSHFVRAFPGDRGHGVATATRLLAMKRPDYFVCLDGANRRRLTEAFNVKVSGRDYERYWDEIVARILVSTWWNSPRPRGAAAMKIWDGRAAFLDSLYYVPK